MSESMVKIFENNEFGAVRIITANNEPMFCLSDLCKSLDLTAKEVNRRLADEVVTKHPIKDSLGRTQNALFVNEDGLYDVILESRKPNARKFRKWVTSEVLPTIRKTGGYVSNDDLFINTYLPFADEPTKLLFKTTLTTINQLNAKIEKDKPLVEFAGRVGDTSGLIDVGAFAKLLHKKNVDIGRTRLFAWLREQKYLRHNNEPYQKWIDSGIFQTREFTYMAQGQPCIGIKTYITGKGQTYLADKIGKMY